MLCREAMMAGKPRRGGVGVARGGQGGRAAKVGSHRKGASAGSGGQRRKALEGRGPTPPAEMRPGHPAQRRAAAQAAGNPSTQAASPRSHPPAAARPRPGAETGSGRHGAAGADTGSGAGAGARRGRRPEGDEIVVGRNAVVEALRAGVPSSVLYIAGGLDYDERLTQARKLAATAGIAAVDVARAELDRMCGTAP